MTKVFIIFTLENMVLR